MKKPGFWGRAFSIAELRAVITNSSTLKKKDDDIALASSGQLAELVIRAGSWGRHGASDRYLSSW
jgi:hypothetical protein